MSMTDQRAETGRELTGRHVAMIFVGAFTIIFGVNIFMARQAIHTFPGLEVENSYIASQTFDAERRAQEALGWTLTPALDGTSLKLDITGTNGGPAEVAELHAMLGRTTERGFDQELAFSQSSMGGRVAEVGALAPGKWELRVNAVAPDGTPFRQRLILMVPEK